MAAVATPPPPPSGAADVDAAAAAAVAGSLPDDPWALARERAGAYLEAAGMAPKVAAEVAPALLAEVQAEAAARSPSPPPAEEGALAVLRAARRALARHAARAAAEAPTGPREVAPASRPLAMPRRAFRSVMDWRLAAAYLRRLLPARSPRGIRRKGGLHAARAAALAPLSNRARQRRLAFLVLISLTTFWGVNTFVQILGVDGLSPLDLAHTAVFTVLLLWLAQSFWTLAAGAVALGRRLRRPAGPTPATSFDAGEPTGGGGGQPPRAAIVVPIYNEDTHHVFARLRAMWEGLATLPEGRRCDLFVLSDTTDPDIWLAELDAWQEMRAAVADGPRVFYRRRLRNLKRKTGNIEDFVTRWGGAYAYMLVLDADSLMTAAAMAELVRRMDANPDVGLIQAPPKLVNGGSVFARMLQFAGELYGPLSASGISYWALGEGNYWGHNAIIRTGPFAELCGLPLLPGKAPLGGEILSHDFVEAALLRRGGWQVWIADDLGGSYEEPPPTVADFATRDRRWCQGNLQHIKVLFTSNLHWVSRLHLAIGIMAYVTSPLWLVFLLLSAAQAWGLAYSEPVYFAEDWLFPRLPVSVEAEAALLLAITLGLLFVPKLMGLFLALLDRERREALGGGLRLAASTMLETLISALLAPVMMLLHTSFVLQILLGAAIDWKPQRRTAAPGAWAEAARRFGWVSVLGVAAAAASAWATPDLFVWLLPVFAGLALAIPLAVLSGSERLGARLRGLRLLPVAEETRPPGVMRRLAELLKTPERGRDRFAEAVLDPGFNTLHTAMLRAAGETPTVSAEAIRAVERKAVYLGPAALDKPERRALLEHPASMARLHLAAWLHWQGGRPLAWEADEPPPPALQPGLADAARVAAE